MKEHKAPQQPTNPNANPSKWPQQQPNKEHSHQKPQHQREKKGGCGC